MKIINIPLHSQASLLRTATENVDNEQKHVDWLKRSAPHRYAEGMAVYRDKKANKLNIRGLV